MQFQRPDLSQKAGVLGLELFVGHVVGARTQRLDARAVARTGAPIDSVSHDLAWAELNPEANLAAESRLPSSLSP